MLRILTILFFSWGALSSASSFGAEKNFFDSKRIEIADDPCAPDPELMDLVERVRAKAEQCKKLGSEIDRMKAILDAVDAGLQACGTGQPDPGGELSAHCRELRARRARALKRLRELESQRAACLAEYWELIRQLDELLRSGPKCDQVEVKG